MMAQRIFIACRSNHDQITLANLACQDLIGKAYDFNEDFLRRAGDFSEPENLRKCQIPVDCNAVRDSAPGEVELSCYNASGDSGDT